MEDVIDHLQTTSSPEELAIHFLLRHAECRRALTGQAGEERLHDAVGKPRSEVPVMPPVGVDSRRSGEGLPSSNPAAAEVTKDDSCTARFLRAYAAARHLEAGAEASGAVEPRRSKASKLNPG